MKTKIVEHIAGNALDEIRSAQGEAVNMRDRYPELMHKAEGLGLDFTVLCDELEKAAKLVALLAK